ncbi:MAG: hypothetical protein IIU65_01730, partial [Clostridia bacterium]|nr:hypothetical protein [Clostridia bacterium]
YQTVLDGTAVAFPSSPESANLGLWSEQLSNEDGTFDEPIVLTLTAIALYSSQGLTLTFDTHNNIYSKQVNIKWYRNGELLADENFQPDNASYFCYKKVDLYNKLVITFYSLNMPKNRLKLRAIDYGYGTVFYGSELRDVKLIQEINPISSEISINTVDFTLDSKSDISYSFQTRQPLSVYFNGELKSTVFVKSAKRKEKRLWRVQSEDYIGLLDEVVFEGGIYVNKNAVELIDEIFSKAKIPYSIEDVFDGETVTGYIPYTNCREALMQVAFAIQAAVDTSGSEVVKIYALEDDIKQVIPLNRIMQGQNFSEEDNVTEVQVTAHSYSPVGETIEAYKAVDSGEGSNIMVSFTEPLHSLSINNGEILTGGSNYAIINANAECILTGKKYEHTTQTKAIKNPLVSANDIDKVIAVEKATLVSSKNLDKVLEKCYNWLVRVNSVNLDIVEGKHIVEQSGARYGISKYGEDKYGKYISKQIIYDKAVNVGDLITAETEYLGDVTGRVIKQTFNLSGGIIVKKAVLR